MHNVVCTSNIHEHRPLLIERASSQIPARTKARKLVASAQLPCFTHTRTRPTQSRRPPALPRPRRWPRPTTHPEHSRAPAPGLHAGRVRAIGTSQRQRPWRRGWRQALRSSRWTLSPDGQQLQAGASHRQPSPPPPLQVCRLPQQLPGALLGNRLGRQLQSPAATRRVALLAEPQPQQPPPRPLPRRRGP